jgi:hypothetical protein
MTITFTADQVNAIAPSKTEIAWSLNGIHFGPFEPVTEIFARSSDVDGKRFVCGYRRFGDNSQISFSIKEGSESDARFYRLRTAGE